MDSEKRRKSLLALSNQQGHYGSVNVDDVLTIIELRDEKIGNLIAQEESLYNNGERAGIRKVVKWISHNIYFTDNQDMPRIFVLWKAKLREWNRRPDLAHHV